MAPPQVEVLCTTVQVAVGALLGLIVGYITGVTFL